MRKKLILAGMVVVLLLSAWGLTSLLSAHANQSHLRDTSDSFISAILANNANGSYAMFTSVTKGSIDQASWKSKVQTLSNFFKGRSPHYLKAETSSDLGFVTYDITGKDGDYRFYVVLNKQAKLWAVQSFSSQAKT